MNSYSVLENELYNLSCEYAQIDTERRRYRHALDNAVSMTRLVLATQIGEAATNVLFDSIMLKTLGRMEDLINE